MSSTQDLKLFWSSYVERVETAAAALPLPTVWQVAHINVERTPEVEPLTSIPFVVHVAVWALLLSRCTGQDNVFFGLDWGGSGSVVPVIVPVNEEQTVGTYLCKVQACIDEIKPYMDISVVDLQEIMQTSGVLFPTAVVTRFLPEFQGQADVIVETGLEFRVHGKTSFYIKEYYYSLVRGMLACPSAYLHELDIMSSEERHLVVFDFNQTGTDYPRDSCLTDLFEEQVQLRPDGIAILFEGQKLTYLELNRQANQLARVLRREGVGRGTFVGVMVDPSPALIVSILAIVKAGGVYVPIDRNYPVERIKNILQDASPIALITLSAFLDKIETKYSRVAICLDHDHWLIESEDSSNLAKVNRASDPVYVNYTSGSTGRPKGVVIPHRGVVRLVRNTNYVELTEEDRFIQIAPVTFDAATFEIWGTLLNGGQLVMVPREVVLSPSLLADAIVSNEITSMFITSALFNQLVEHRPESLSSVRNLVVGGDTLSVQHVRKALQFVRKESLVNGYGPTENTTFSCCHRFEQIPEGAVSIPIGRPISNSTAYLLDKRMRPVPVGVVGELYVGGDGLALSYLNMPGKTAESFVVHPFQDRTDTRLYKTGDFGRWTHDGMIEFLGRADAQVKIRGFRIELGEVETALLTHEALTECVVVVREDIPGQKRLAAFYTAQRIVSVVELKEHIARKLPKHMFPSLFVQLQALPMSVHGKVDRSALAAWQAKGKREEFDQAMTPLQQGIMRIWEEVLRLNQIGLRDNFFDIGGDSLLLMTIQERLDKELGHSLPTSILLEYSSVERLAEYLDRGESKTTLEQRIQHRLGLRESSMRKV